jgi:hypothetical protein
MRSLKLHGALKKKSSARLLSKLATTAEQKQKRFCIDCKRSHLCPTPLLALVARELSEHTQTGT